MDEFAAISAFLAFVAVSAASCLQMAWKKPATRRRFVSFADFDYQLYEEAQDLPFDPKAGPTEAQVAFAKFLRVTFPDRATASRALDILDDAMVDLRLTWKARDL